MQEDSEKNRPARKSNEARTAETRQKLLKAARNLFANQGFAGASTPEIVKAAGVTRGALYHHFGDKEGLFRALIESEAKAIAAHINNRSSAPSSAVEALATGTRAYFEAMAVEGRGRLFLIEAPAVLGHDAMAELEREHGTRSLKNGLDQTIASGSMAPFPTGPVSDVLSAAYDRAALAVADGAALEDYEAAINTLLKGLLSLGHET